MNTLLCHTNLKKDYVIYLCRSEQTTASRPNLGCHLFKMKAIFLEHSRTHLLVWGCFHISTAVPSSCNRDHIAGKAESGYSPALDRKQLSTPVALNGGCLGGVGEGEAAV